VTPAPRRSRRGDEDVRRIHEFVELVAAAARSPRQRERILRAAGAPLAESALTALRVIHRRGPVAVTEVARNLGLDQTTVSRQVRPLEEHGLVRRTPADGDRRVVRLEATRDGTRLLEQVRAVGLHDLDVALTGWSAADRRRLAELLDRLRRGMYAARVDVSGWSLPPE
jgi:DNA-binding MarR family transcriptional regulator